MCTNSRVLLQAAGSPTLLKYPTPRPGMPRTGIEECHLRQSRPTQGLCLQLSWVTIRHFSTCGQCLPCGPCNTRTETVTAGIATVPASQRKADSGRGRICAQKPPVLLPLAQPATSVGTMSQAALPQAKPCTCTGSLFNGEIIQRYVAPHIFTPFSLQQNLREGMVPSISSCCVCEEPLQKARFL